MGAGIAQLALEAGARVVIHDPDPSAVERARDRIADGIARRTRRRSPADAGLAERTVAEAIGRLEASADLEQLARAADVVIEAALEDLALKRSIFTGLDAAARPGTILATNTSALSVAAIAAATGHPERVVGLHFFNPAPVMALVEVVAPSGADPAVVRRATELVAGWGKTAVRSADSPGFIVNRVNRPFTLEALALLEAGLGSVESIDAAVRAAGYPMGPFELMDLVGIDVNLAAARGIYQAFRYEPRFRPSPIQERLVEAGRLGRKSREGFYWYGEDGRSLGQAGAFASDPALAADPAGEIRALPAGGVAATPSSPIRSSPPSPIRSSSGSSWPSSTRPTAPSATGSPAPPTSTSRCAWGPVTRSDRSSARPRSADRPRSSPGSNGGARPAPGSSPRRPCSRRPARPDRRSRTACRIMHPTRPAHPVDGAARRSCAPSTSFPRAADRGRGPHPDRPARGLRGDVRSARLRDPIDGVVGADRGPIRQPARRRPVGWPVGQPRAVGRLARRARARGAPPERVGDVALQRLSLAGRDFYLTGTDETRGRLDDMLAKLGKTVSDLSVADAGDPTGIAVLEVGAFRVAGADSTRLLAEWVASNQATSPGRVQVSNVTLDGRALTRLVDTGRPGRWHDPRLRQGRRHLPGRRRRSGAPVERARPAADALTAERPPA